MNTQELIQFYYTHFANKQGWETVIADDFQFVGGDMMKQNPVAGKLAYQEIILRFSQHFTNMRPKEIFVQGDRAFVLANYDFVFPNDTRANASVAELWKTKNEKLSELTIFFDTDGFRKLLTETK